MSTLVEFLLARIAEDEQVTRTMALGGTFTEPGQVLHDSDCMFLWAVESSDRNCDCGGERRWVAECTAKRRIVELHTGHHECVGIKYGQQDCVLVSEGYMFENDPTLCLLALPYADHPDYDAAWAVDDAGVSR